MVYGPVSFVRDLGHFSMRKVNDHVVDPAKNRVQNYVRAHEGDIQNG